MRLVFRETAYADLRRIHEWIADDRPASAEPVIDRILESVLRLARFPLIGRKGQHPGTLEWIVPHLPYIIVYVIDEIQGQLEVVAIFHVRQNRE